MKHHIINLLRAPFILFMYPLWVMYLAVMNLERARDAGTLTPHARALGTPLLFLGLLVDFLYNVVVLTVLFLELPRELLVTARVSRHKKDGRGFRKALATWFCVNLLDPYDPDGCHCK
jgi:hypothetical protein